MGQPENPMNAVEHSIPSDQFLLRSARRTLEIEAAALEALRQGLDQSFARACGLCLRCSGRIVVTGMGKSGHVAHKVAATLASTGSPAFFLHPGEASHGDLGMLTRNDLLLALSNSGETVEVLTLLPQVKRLAVPLIALTGNPDSTLARAADVHINVAVAEEACPHNLTPTASTTVALVMGDALAVALLEARGFSPEDFARSHPGGSLGRRLLTRVEDIMRRGDALPRVRPDTPLSKALLEMTRTGLGLTTIVDDREKVLGVFSDGDLRRALDRRVDLNTSMQEIMTPGGRRIGPHELAAAAAALMEAHRVTALVVTDAEGHLMGAFNVHDLMRAGVV
ncbi:MAG TPA: KpsF/GutQ family sugar-phosphate isomerase [Steroidobacteraceae bacterium]|jgi:arabinose-5-phosphate isomerase